MSRKSESEPMKPYFSISNNPERNSRRGSVTRTDGSIHTAAGR